MIGGGPSGKDILYEVARSANRVTFSHHRDLSKNNFGANVTQKGDVRKFTENGVEFADGSTENFSAVLFCTGLINNQWYRYRSYKIPALIQLSQVISSRFRSYQSTRASVWMMVSILIRCTNT